MGLDLFLWTRVSQVYTECYHIYLNVKTTLHISWPLLQSSIFRKISVWNMFNSVHNYKNWIEWVKKGGHCIEPVHFDLYQSFVWPCAHAFSCPTQWTKCNILLMEMSSKSPGFIKCWPRCLNHNVAIASQLQRTCKTVSDTCSCLAQLRLFTSPSIINVILNDTVMLIT
jgi:hypothetical protein